MLTWIFQVSIKIFLEIFHSLNPPQGGQAKT